MSVKRNTSDYMNVIQKINNLKIFCSKIKERAAKIRPKKKKKLVSKKFYLQKKNSNNGKNSTHNKKSPRKTHNPGLPDQILVKVARSF
jgi:hypothetical protein